MPFHVHLMHHNCVFLIVLLYSSFKQIAKLFGGFSVAGSGVQHGSSQSFLERAGQSEPEPKSGSFVPWPYPPEARKVLTPSDHAFYRHLFEGSEAENALAWSVPFRDVVKFFVLRAIKRRDERREREQQQALLSEVSKHKFGAKNW